MLRGTENDREMYRKNALTNGRVRLWGLLGKAGERGEYMRFEDVKTRGRQDQTKREVITIPKVLSNSRGSCLQKMLF